MSFRKVSFRQTTGEKKNPNQFKTVFVHLLDNNQLPLEIEIIDNMNGIILLDKVCLLLGGILERDYFGLRYLYRDQYKKWLDGNQSVHHQIKKAKTTTLAFRVKHYPKNPFDDVNQDIVRYFLYLQLRRDLHSENLIMKKEMLTKLISLVIQAERGDQIDPTPEEILMLVNDLTIVENVTSQTLEDVSKYVVTLGGLDAKDAEKQFLLIISNLESYGVEPYKFFDRTGEKSFITMNHQGICIFSGEKRKIVFYWENISKLMFVKKSFQFEVNIDNKKKVHQYKFHSEPLAKEFWKWATDRQYFMTLNNSGEAKKVRSNNSIFNRKVSHRFSGRSLRELTASCQTLNDMPQPPIIRTHNVAITRSNSFKAICRHSVNLEDHVTTLNTYATIPRRSKVDNEISLLAIGSENCGGHINESLISITSGDSLLIEPEQITNEAIEPDLPAIKENKVISESVEGHESKLQQSLFDQFEPIMEASDNETDGIRERDFQVTKSSNGPITSSHNHNNIISDHDSDHLQNVDGMFFIKFVILTTLILLVVMVTSLVAYYHYRSSTIADLNKQKYSSEWNKNIDLESIKRFVLRNDAP